MTADKEESISRPSKPRNKGTFWYLQMVVGVAFLLATLFTAWTEPGLLPSSLSESLNSALAKKETPQSSGLPTTTARPKLRIGIVAGHSGNDPGAVCPAELGGIREVDINLTIANLTRENLINEGYDVDLLAEFDPRLTGYQALALISIHADSCDYVNEQATGFKIAAAMSTLYPEQTERLTSCLRNRYTETTGLSFHPGSVTTDMTGYHAFSEIHNQTPATIIEVGFMNLDRKILTEQPELLARGITSGILCYVRNEDISSPPTTTP